ncbi:uncharacterized protein K452DRAFT_145854 [Aplosporella prunicola CBS 121167]|uniref:Uncharacterized protein n=1 Tax=Aplosporella prunicola CBS 121167 TaxID=1176127 RepID=A0A6A6BNA4_9PEZI|nr:uncharacterized protein K452DRAFT_145854 [Aplosporella prunicola CBS 121167]KAF2144724.1 hypothetical protein K452DRAFT_145854 [Aplosporella prunicola CBS 121167]
MGFGTGVKALSTSIRSTVSSLNKGGASFQGGHVRTAGFLMIDTQPAGFGELAYLIFCACVVSTAHVVMPIDIGISNAKQ